MKFPIAGAALVWLCAGPAVLADAPAVPAVPAGNAGAAKGEIVARVGPIEIDRATFEAELARSPGDTAKSAEQERRDFMAAFLNRQLLVLAAKEAGYFDPEPTRDFMIRGFEESTLSRRVRDEEVMSKANLSPADVDSFHARQQYLYDVSQILVATPEDAERVKARLAAGEDFAALAAEMSLDEKSRYKGGQLEPFLWGLTNRSFLEALDQMAPGEIRGPIPSEVGYHVVRLNGRPPNTSYKPLEPQRAFIASRAVVFAQMDTLVAHTRRLEERYHFTPNWPVIAHVCSMYTTAAATAERDHPTTPREDLYEIAKRSLRFPETLQTQTVASWDFGRYLVKDQVELVWGLPGLAIADRRNPHFILGDARMVFLRGAEVEEARRRGYDQDPEFLRAAARKREELAVGEYYNQELVQKATFDSTAERAYYEAHLDQFTYEPQVRLACIQYQTDADAASAMEEALRSPGGDPDSVVADHERRGLIRTRIAAGKWFPEPQYPILYERTAGLEKGTVGRVVDEEGYWTVFVVLDHQPAKLLPLEEVRQTVKTSLLNLRADELLKERLAELAKKYPVWTDEGYLAHGGSD
jgi:parvulin-like peptidyl-prolyl isomerase